MQIRTGSFTPRRSKPKPRVLAHRRTRSVKVGGKNRFLGDLAPTPALAVGEDLVNSRTRVWGRLRNAGSRATVFRLPTGTRHETRASNKGRSCELVRSHSVVRMVSPVTNYAWLWRPPDPVTIRNFFTASSTEGSRKK